MMKYFKYELKKNIFALGCLTLISSAIYMIIVLTASLPYNYYDLGTQYISIIGGILALVVPIWLLSYKMKRRSTDLYYSLPLSHTKILLSRYLLGLVCVYVPYTIAFWLGTFVVMARAFDDITSVWYLAQYFGSILPIYLIYSITAFIYTRANKFIDGLFFVLFWTFALTLIVHSIIELFDLFYNSYIFLPFTPLDHLTAFCKAKIISNNYISPTNGVLTCITVSFTLNGLMSVRATAGLILSEKRHKAENAGQISESLFGYKVMIPLYTVCLLSLTDLEAGSDYILIVLIAVAIFLLSVLYKRSIKIGKWQAIIVGIAFIAGIILAIFNTVL